MKAAVCYRFGKPLVIDDVELAQPQLGEVKVKIAACAICHSDILYMEGAWGGQLPAVYGHEAAGIVEQVGDGVTRLKPGDHAVVTLIRACGHCYFCAQGQASLCETQLPLDKHGPLSANDGAPIKQGLRTSAFAEYVVVDQSQVVAIPPSLPLDSASLLACGVITGLGAVVNTAALRPGSHTVVIGTGGVGLNSVQGAALSNARTTVAIDLADAKLEAARAFGATHTVNPTRQDAQAEVFKLTAGRGADAVFVTVGSVEAIEQGASLLRRGGALVIVGMTAIGMKARFEALDLADGALRILGSKMGAARLQVDIPLFVQWYQQGRLKLDELISARYPLEDINAAIAAVKRGEALRNVIVFD